MPPKLKAKSTLSISTTSSSSHHSSSLLSPRDESEVTYQEMPPPAMVPAISPEPRIFMPGPSDYFSATVTSAPLPSTADSLISTIIDANEYSLLSSTPRTSISSSSSNFLGSSSAFTHSPLSSVYSSSPPMSPPSQAPHPSVDAIYPNLHDLPEEAPPRRPQNFPSSSGSRSAPDLTADRTIFSSSNRMAPDFDNFLQRGMTYNSPLSYSMPSLMQTAPAPSDPRSPYTPFRAFEHLSIPPQSTHTAGRYFGSILYHPQSPQPWNTSGHTSTILPDPRVTPHESTSFRHINSHPTTRLTTPLPNTLASQAAFGVPTGVPYGAQGAFLETPIARDAILTYAYRLYSTFIRQADGLTSFPHQSQPDATTPAHPYQNQLLPLLTSMRSLHPQHLPTLLLLSCAHYAAGDFDACLTVSNEILSVDPNYVEAMSNIGMVMKEKGALKEAETWWLKAVRLRPTYWDAIDNLLKTLCEPLKTTGGVEIPARYQEALDVVDYVLNILLRHDGLLLVMVPPAHLHRLQNILYTSGNLRSTIRLDINAGLHDYVRALELMFRPPGSVESEDPLTLRDVVIATVIIGLLACQPQDSTMLHSIADVLSIDSSRFHRGMLDRNVDWLQLVHLNSQRVVEVLLREGDGALPIVFLPPEKAERLLDSLFSAFVGKLPGLCTRPSYEEPWQLAPGVNNFKEAGKVTAASLLALAKFLQYKRGKTIPTLFGHGKELPRSQSLVLALYYLAASFDPSPSTYNNMGILLSSVKRTANVINAHGQRETTNGTSLARLYYTKGLAMDPNHVHLLTNYGSLLKDQGRSLEAINMYQRALGLNPNFEIALANIASALKDSGRIKEAIEYYQRALAVFPDFPDAVCGLVHTLSSVCDWRGGRGSSGNEPIVNENLEYLPRKDEADRTPYGWMGELETLVRRQVQEMYSDAAGLVQATGSVKDWLNVVGYAHGSKLSGSQFRRWEKLFRRFYTDFDREEKAVNEIGFLIRLVEAMNRVLQRRWYNEANGGVQKHWSEKTTANPGYRRARLPGSLEPPPIPSVLPFHTFTYAFDDRLLRIITYRNALRISYQGLTASWLPQTVFEPPPAPLEKINIGYFSSDFNNHPLTHLMLSVFRMHDREKFNVHVYATAGSDHSYYRQNIEQNAQIFRDFSSSPVQAMVEQIVADKIHILINLGGYTKGAKNEVFAVRPCPVQVSLMGYAGTSAASWCDYLIADAHAAPVTAFAPYRQAIHKKKGEETSRMQDHFAELDLEADISEEDADPESLSLEWAFTEKFVHMPHSYFVTDHRQAFREDDYFDSSLSPDEIWSLEERFRQKMRNELFPDLPENTIIFACFSQLYKICPRVFWIWMKILRRVPDSILWLLRFPSAGEENLLRAAAAWGGPEVASRVRFTDIAKKDVHVRRCRVADLFLDTFSCNAHTIAADVLWTGTPILTWPKERHKMCTRVASSIAYATGFGESMVVSSETAYENRAVALAKSVSYLQESDGEGGYYRRGSGELIELRRQIFTNRDRMPLFDTERWTRNAEKAYQEMWKHWVESCKPPWTDVDKNGGCIVITDEEPFFST